MCDYSLHHVGSRAAKVNDKLITMELARSHHRGFAAVGELGAKLVIDEAPPKVAVCLMPGTELAFDDYIQHDRTLSFLGKTRTRHKLARFRQIDTDDTHIHHDALELSDGQILKVARLVAGQSARVLQLPVVASHSEAHHEHAETRRAGGLSASRIALDRVSLRSGMASILMPSQGAVMLWQSCRSTASELAITLKQSLRRLSVCKRPASSANTDPETVAVDFDQGVGVARPPMTSTARKPETKAVACPDR